jgi:hypothetical protein
LKAPLNKHDQIEQQETESSQSELKLNEGFKRRNEN